jgi:hypothetical protein
MTTVAITDYASLTTGINDFAERSYAAGETDRFIGLAEAEFRLYLGPNFAKEASTVLTVTSGSAPLPAGFVRSLSLIHLTYGGLTEASIGTVRERRIWDTGGIPKIYAVTGSTVEVASSYSGALTFDFEGSLTGLSSGNTTNWLITNAPQAYLSMCLSMEKAFNEDYQGASIAKADSFRVLNDLGIQSMVAQAGRASVRIPGPTP